MFTDRKGIWKRPPGAGQQYPTVSEQGVCLILHTAEMKGGSQTCFLDLEYSQDNSSCGKYRQPFDDSLFKIFLQGFKAVQGIYPHGCH